MSLNDAIFTQIRSLALSALPDGSSVIKGRQNKPAPDNHYLVIMPVPEIETHGQASERFVDGVVTRKQDWSGEVDIRELGGDGDWLQLLLGATEKSTVKDHLTTLSFLTATNIQDLSYQEGDKWVLEARMGFKIAVRTSSTEDIGYFDRLGVTIEVGGLDIPLDINTD